MRLMDLVWRDKRVVRRVLAATAVTAIAHVLVMSALNERIRHDGPMLPFLMGAVVFLFSSRFTGHEGALIVKKLIFDMRVRIAEKIRRAELSGIETIGVAEIRDQLTEQLEIISFGTVELVWLPQFASMAIVNALYLASISPSAALVTSLVHGAGLLAMYLHSSTLQAEMKASAGERRRFAAAFGDLLGGFKEIKLRRRRGEAIVREIETLAEDLETSSVRAHVSRNDDGVFALSTRYALLGLAAFALPTYFSLDTNETQDFVVGLLFLWTPALAVIQIYPAFVRASLAADSLHELERKLDDATYVLPRAKGAIDPWGGHWSSLETRDVELVYQGEAYESFRLGPLNLSIAAGEIVFVVGNNGAGKSTLLKLLSGLYHPSAGSIAVDGVELGPANIQAYREMIAAVLANSHLFSELYGLKDVQDEVVRAMLRKMEIEHDVAFEGGRFSRLNLSTGQRKRVALLVALLEDRPVMVFDEWAADQDPEFRKRFYEEVLPDLKRRGKTVLVATHDDRYFHLADKLITLHSGRLRETAQPTLHAESSPMTTHDMP